VDPLWEEMPGSSPFHYCFNNPIMMRDPFGLEPDGQSTKRGSVFSKKTDDDAPDAGITDEVVCEAEGPWSHWWSFMEGSRRGNEWTAYTGAARMGEPTAADKVAAGKSPKALTPLEKFNKVSSAVDIANTTQAALIDAATKDKNLGSAVSRYRGFLWGVGKFLGVTQVVANGAELGSKMSSGKPFMGTLLKTAISGALLLRDVNPYLMIGIGFLEVTGVTDKYIYNPIDQYFGNVETLRTNIHRK
jgi:hypothetical protein